MNGPVSEPSESPPPLGIIPPKPTPASPTTAGLDRSYASWYRHHGPEAKGSFLLLVTGTDENPFQHQSRAKSAAMEPRTISSSTICVVGAGPVGLFTALLLAQAGISVAVFEKEQQIVQSPRAMGYFGVTQDEFRKAGILDDIRREALVNNQRLRWRRPKDGECIVEIPGHAELLQLGQHDVAKIILRHLLKYPHAEVNFGNSLEFLVQDQSGVSTQYSVATSGIVREHTSNFLVGADGGKSSVRKHIGAQLEGFTWESFQMMALTIEYDLASLGWAPGNVVLGDDIWAIIAQVGKGTTWRIAYGIPRAELDPSEPYDEERERSRCLRTIENLLPGPTEEAVITTFSLYQPRQMCATKFTHGRVALAGDSAHLTSPLGGLGLTMGILDSALLARVLKKVILESQPLELLESSYGEIRRDVFQNVANPAAIFQTQIVVGSNEEDLAKRQEHLEHVRNQDVAYLKKYGEVYSKITSTSDN
ncbi:FAD/NAD(P)-binding domain-containing protein [Thozetella sp. PMI_491]|nr:FAD/NAD(P)-binding domain-containing protein [Thozetella sp. PMI_491]